MDGWGYPTTGVVDQQWNESTGRAAINWTPKLDFTDQTLIYGSYAHGYKAGGANPPGAVLLTYGGDSQPTEISTPVHPLTFKPEFVDAFEVGSKNTLLDGALTINGDVASATITRIIRFQRSSRSYLHQFELRRACERRRDRSGMGANSRISLQFRWRLGRCDACKRGRSNRSHRPHRRASGLDGAEALRYPSFQLHHSNLPGDTAN